jgi:hypothetical protein
LGLYCDFNIIKKKKKKKPKEVAEPPHFGQGVAPATSHGQFGGDLATLKREKKRKKKKRKKYNLTPQTISHFHFSPLIFKK